MQDNPLKVLLASDQFVTEPILEQALLEQVPDAEISTISSTWPVPFFFDIGEVREAHGDEDELIAAMEGCQVVFSHTFPFTEKVIAASPDLRMITICRGGPINVNLEAATKHGVIVSYTPGRNATATAEHTVALLLAAVRQVPQRHTDVVSGDWRSDYYQYRNVGPEVGSSTVGVIGYGAVGRKVARILSSFGAQVLVFDPWADPTGADPGVQFTNSLDDLLQSSNIVTLHARADETNHHMIGAEQLALMPESSVLVNCARGSLVDYDAVCDAIDSGHLFAAAFDTMPQEPLPPGHRLLSTPRIVFTPHLGGASKQAAHLAAEIGAADIGAFSRGETPKYVANPEVLDTLTKKEDVK